MDGLHAVATATSTLGFRELALLRSCHQFAVALLPKKGKSEAVYKDRKIHFCHCDRHTIPYQRLSLTYLPDVLLST